LPSTAIDALWAEHLREHTEAIYATRFEMALTLEQISAARLDRMTINARALLHAGHLRPGITPAEAADILWTYSAPELYELLVLRKGWSAKQHGKFIADAMINALLDPE